MGMIEYHIISCQDND